jgi:hypothetical protein
MLVFSKYLRDNLDFSVRSEFTFHNHLTMGFGRQKSKMGVTRPTKKVKVEEDATVLADVLAIPDYIYVDDDESFVFLFRLPRRM